MDQGNNLRWKPIISVIIPTFNSRAEIGPCLEGLINQTYPRESIEVIVVDSGSDDTSKIAEKIASKVFKSTSRLNAGQARNIGISLAKGEILAFIDSDNFVPKTWVETIIKDFEEFPEVGGISFGVSGGNTTFTKWINYEFAKDTKFVTYSGCGKECGIVFRKRVFELGCRFGEDPQNEGFILSHCLQKNNIPVLIDSTSRIVHPKDVAVLRWMKRSFTLGAFQRSYVVQIGGGYITNTLLSILVLISILSFLLFMFFPFNLILPILTLLILAFYTIKNDILPNKFAPVRAKINFFFLGIINRVIFWLGYVTKLITGRPKPKYYNG